MQSESDAQLLREYAEHGVEASFAEIVRRHTNLVYSAALRQVGSPDTAAEVAQRVFIGLARRAKELVPRLAQEASLAGWLCRTARNISLNLRRDDFRRQSREKEAMKNLEPISAHEPDWEQLQPALDEAMSELNETDYDALVLRYFQKEDLRSVGVALGVSEDTAQKRVARALDTLRELLTHRGITTSAGVLTVLLSANAVQAAPVGLALSISTAAALTGATVASATATVTKTIIMTTLQKTLITAVVVAAVGTGIYEAREVSRLREQVQLLQQKQAPSTDELQQLQRERDEAANRLAALADEMERSKGNSSELLKLRNEVGRLRQTAQELAQLKAGSDPTISEAVSWKERVKSLQQHLAQNPGANIPELQFATEQDWLNAAKGELKTEKDYRQAMSGLRHAVENKFASQMQSAVKRYMEANKKQFPTDLSQLQSYFEPPVDAAILQRYAILPKEEIPTLGMGGKWIISQKAPVDEEFDSRTGIGPSGWGSAGQAWKPDPAAGIAKALSPLVKAYSSANGGNEPTEVEELLPYIKTVEQRAAYEKALALKASRSGRK